MARRIPACDGEALHRGNRGLAIDHEAVAREVDALMERMSLAQQVNEIRGDGVQPIEGLWHAGGDAELGIPAFRMVDGPRGVRAGRATAFPVAIARGASFDPALERRVGLAMGREAAAKGANVLLAPTINLLRHPGWGRAQETYSEDAHHMGAMAAAFVSGVQNHVLASPKHFAANNLEMTRFELSAEIDERTLHELYLPHFKRCVVEAAAGSVMSAYNKLNGIYCGEHPELLTAILREAWGFRGFVESDWFLGTRSTAEAIRAGLDIEMPAPFRRSDEKLAEALESGALEEADIEQAARHVVHAKLAWRLDALPRPDPEVVECAEHVALAREAAVKSMVLLKNEGALLPLEDRPGLRLALVGDLAAEANLGDRGSSFVHSTEVTTPLEGLRAALRHARLEHFASDADFSRLGEFDAAIVVAGLDYKDEGEFIPTQQQEAEGDELARGGDRAGLALPAPQRELVERAARAARRCVVVLEGGSAIEVSEWFGSVDALLMAWYPGREGGHALADVLLGREEPSGRLPVSFPRSSGQLMPWDVSALEVPHDLLHGYRFLDHHGHDPEFPFGFGLGYTRFELGALEVRRDRDGFRLVVPVTNSGARRGTAVPQLYVSCEGSSVFRVPKELRGFGRVELEVGETAELEIALADDELRYYQPGKGWQLEPCGYRLRVGFSSRELPLESAWRYDGDAWSPEASDPPDG